MEKIEVSAKTIDKAIEEGLQQLGVNIEQVEINVISEGGLFKKAKIEMLVINENKPVTKAPLTAKEVEFTDKELEFMGEKREASSEKKEEQPKKEGKEKKTIKAERKESVTLQKISTVSEKTEKTEKINKTEKAKTESKKENISKSAEYEIKPVKNREERKKENEFSVDDSQIREAVKVAGKTFLEGIINTLGMDAKVSVNEVEGNIEFAVDGSNLGSLIGYRGAALESLQYLLNVVVGNKTGYKKRVYLNIENYRQKREDTLKSMADRIVNKVIENKRRCKLEPMSSFERRVIHTYLSGREKIVTKSEGIEPNRYLIIEYKE